MMSPWGDFLLFRSIRQVDGQRQISRLNGI
jgi:hypothetical protein